MCDQKFFRPLAFATAVYAALTLSVFGASPVRAQTTLTSGQAATAAVPPAQRSKVVASRDPNDFEAAFNEAINR